MNVRDPYNKKIMVVTRTIPHWRREVFQEIYNQFKSHGVDCLFVHDYKAMVIGNHKGSGICKSINSKHCEIKTVALGKVEYLKRFRTVLNQYKPSDIIIEASPRFMQVYYLLLLKKFKHFKLWGWSSGYFKSESKCLNFLRKLIFRNFDGMFTYHSLATKKFERIGIKKIITVGNSPGEKRILDEIGRVDPHNVKLVKLNYSDDEKKLIAIFVGKLTVSKKVDIILSVAEYFEDRINFLIIGNGPEYNNLEKTSKAKHLSNVFFMGEIIEGVNVLFQASDVFVMPGTGGLALIQALYNGLPIISSFADGIGFDAVKDGYNGFIMEDPNEEFFIEKLQWFVDNKAAIDEFSRRSLEISKYFSTEKVAERIVSTILEE